MKFTGIIQTFSTKNNKQFRSIGLFWDILKLRYNSEDLVGLGYCWNLDQEEFDYAIGLRSNKEISGYNFEIDLPDEQFWETVTGFTSDLESIYSEIYKRGRIKYELEYFNDDGTCMIKYILEPKRTRTLLKDKRRTNGNYK